MTTNEIEELKTQEGIVKLLKANFDPSHGLDIYGISENAHKCDLLGEILYQSLLAYGEKEYLRGREDHIREENCNCQCSACSDCGSTQP